MLRQVISNFFHAIHSFYLWSSHKSCLHRILGFIFLGLISRFLPHPPNFMAMNAIALFSICSLGTLGVSLFTVFSTMLFCDLFFGFHSSMVFVYFSLGMIVLLGYGLKGPRSRKRTALFLAASSLLFFVITNFGVWLTGSMYPKTLVGLELCYLAALPFLANNLISTFFYGSLLFLLSAYSEHNTCILNQS